MTVKKKEKKYIFKLRMPKCLYNKQEMTAGEMFWELRVDGEVVTGLAEGSGPMKEMLKKIQVP